MRLTDKIELRITRPGMYARDCQNPEYMEGHYFSGIDHNDALIKAKLEFPSEPLKIQVFKILVDGIWYRQ